MHTAGSFTSQVSIAKDGEEADAKSILGILLLAAAQGTQVILRCDGDDEAEAMEAVTRLFADRFGEES